MHSNDNGPVCSLEISPELASENISIAWKYWIIKNTTNSFSVGAPPRTIRELTALLQAQCLK